MAATNPYTINPVTAESLAAGLDGRDDALLSYDELAELLNHIQKYRLRRPQLVAKYGQILLSRFQSRLGEARAAVLREQILLAALDLHDMALMEEMDEELTAVFANSNRRLRLHAMREEVAFVDEGNCEDPEAMANGGAADSIYEGMIEENFSNLLARKREIALTRDRGEESAAIEKLVKFLEIFQNDGAGWMELGELYASRNNFEEAKFCYEELLTINPRDPAQPFHVCRYAEILYSMGSEAGKNPELVEQARCYFALSLQMQVKGNLRALFGLLTASKHVLESKSLSAHQVEATASLAHAQEEIANYYEAAGVDDETQEGVDHVLQVFSAGAGE